MSITALTCPSLSFNKTLFCPAILGKFSFHDDAGEAVEAIVKKEKPQVIAFGEEHEPKSGSTGASTLQVFHKEIFPRISKYFDLLLSEAFAKEEECSPEIEAFYVTLSKQIGAPETSKELAKLEKAAENKQIKSENLPLSCKDINNAGVGDFIDLIFLGRLVKGKAEKIVLESVAKNKKVIYYGGAIHNDIEPEPLFEEFSFGKTIAKKGIKYVEIDIIKPELALKRLKGKKLEQFKGWMKFQPKNKVVVVNPRPHSYIIILPPSKPAPSPIPPNPYE